MLCMNLMLGCKYGFFGEFAQQIQTIDFGHLNLHNKLT